MNQFAEDSGRSRSSRATVNAYLVGDVVVDAGYRALREEGRRAVRGREVRAHALTHVHNDHAGGTKHVREALGVPVWIGAGDAPYLRSGKAPIPPGAGSPRCSAPGRGVTDVPRSANCARATSSATGSSS